MAEEKQVKYDVDGYDVVTTALRDLLNQFPRLPQGEEIAFSSLGEERGKAMFPVSGAVIEQERTSITGKVRQVCLYPFFIIYRASGLSEERRAEVKEWLDGLGRWLEELEKYPALTGTRKVLSISRQTPAYLDSTNENKSEDWAISLSLRYQNEFFKNRRSEKYV